MKNIPNCITATRIVLSLALLFIMPLSPVFIAVYILCGITDITDGPIARKTGAVSQLGARFDSAADLVMICVSLKVFIPLVKPPSEVIVWVAVIFAVRSASMIKAYVRYKTFAVLHTFVNKLTGLMLFLFPVSLTLTHSSIPMYIMCAVASISAVEELIIHSTSWELDIDRKSLFTK